jgi:eukaryotic-like serine/threonine-protein kinase
VIRRSGTGAEPVDEDGRRVRAYNGASPMRCTSCSAPLLDSDLTCPRCGAEQAVSDLPTGTAPRATPARPTPARTPPARSPGPRTPGPAGRTSAAASGRFAPGTLLGQRFRIVGLLGRGGMGEVYRADDMKLDQPVALKFLPEALQQDPDRLDRFYGEVRLARQIAHPSICRVYDVVEEEDGTPFLSMEYVDGEDLGSLARRIGRLPVDKALEVARQLCAGLSAAHEKGVLHRDLKPENVMIDGRGHARITDFGLAVGIDGVSAGDVRSGTPAYMSPEQLAGREVTVRSDVYALGLVLYELFTGRKAVEASSLAELERKVREEAPTPPSELVPDLDPAIERAIVRCLEKDPRHRPASVSLVAAALPGGDPLAAALAAGETPSPELVAAAGTTSGLRPSTAWALLLGVLLALPLLPVLWQPQTITALVPMEKTPDALEDRGRELLGRIGQAGAGTDRARGFAIDIDYLLRILQNDQSATRWQALRSGPPVCQFWYRQSPRSLKSSGVRARVTWDEPPPLEPEMAGLRFDTRGRLIQLYVVPPQLETPPVAPLPSPDFDVLFSAAGLERGVFRAVEPRWTPPFFADARAAWDGVHPERPDVPLHVEAASYRGRPVFFHVLPPWARADRTIPYQWTRSQRAAQIIGIGLFLGIMATAALMARRNVRLGRGDKVGAHRLARYMTLVMGVVWMVNADHVFDLNDELTLLVRGLGMALLLGAIMFTLYLALEPLVRRRWPQTMISWTRVLAGLWRDPLVGRDVLVGTAAGILAALLTAFARALPAWAGQAATLPHSPHLDSLLGARDVVSVLVAQQMDAAALGIGYLLVVTLLRQLTRSTWAALGILLLVLSLPDTLIGVAPAWMVLVATVLINGIAGVVFVRLGLLAGIVTVYVMNMLMTFPLSTDLSSWTATPTFWVAGVVVALVVYGFRTALGGRPALGSSAG